MNYTAVVHWGHSGWSFYARNLDALAASMTRLRAFRRTRGSLGKRPGLQSRVTAGFDTLTACWWRVAQQAEQRPVKAPVAGSTPATPAEGGLMLFAVVLALVLFVAIANAELR